MKYVAVLFFLLITSIAQAAERSIAIVGAEFWVSPRSGEAVLNNAAISGGVKLLMEDPEAYLVLHHPQSEFGELWGQELQAWLVSLGIISDRLELRAGFESDGVELIVVTTDAEPDLSLPQIGEESIDSEALILEEWNSETMLEVHAPVATDSDVLELVEQEQEQIENERVESDIEAEETESEVPSQDEVELQ